MSALVPVYGKAGVVAHSYVDAEDIEIVRDRRWYLSTKGYAMSRGSVRMHRLILGIPKGDPRLVDHINGDRLDNRRDNLRCVTPAQSAQNRGDHRGTSWHRGVMFEPGRQSSKKWRAQVKVGGRVYSGYFATEQEAVLQAIQWRGVHMPYAVER